MPYIETLQRKAQFFSNMLKIHLYFILKENLDVYNLIGTIGEKVVNRIETDKTLSDTYLCTVQKTISKA